MNNVCTVYVLVFLERQIDDVQECGVEGNAFIRTDKEGGDVLCGVCVGGEGGEGRVSERGIVCVCVRK